MGPLAAGHLAHLEALASSDCRRPPGGEGNLLKSAAPNRPEVRRTVGAIAALVAGFAVGIFVHGSGDPALGRLVDAVGVLGQLWVSALRMTVLPLVIALTLVAIVGARGKSSIGVLGANALVLFVTMHVAAVCLTLAVTTSALASYEVDLAAGASFRAQVSEPAPDAPADFPRATSVGDWLLGLVPVNVFASATKGEILPILLFTAVFGLAVRRLAPQDHDLLRRVFEGFAGAMMVIVGWVLKVMPLGVFALCAVFASRLGSRATSVIVFFIVLLSGILLSATLLLYPVTAVLGRTSIARFARAVAPAQVVAVSTRSSLASLPALVDGGRKHLALSESATGFVLPLSVATFKFDYMISGLVRLLFVAHVLDIPLGAPALGSFLITLFLLSFSAAGIPGAGAVRSLPAYLAAGIPLEGVLILNAVDSIPDIFATLGNVTADMSAATILSRKDRARPAVGSLPTVAAP